MSTLSTANIQSKAANTPPVIKDLNGTESGQFARAWVNFNGVGTVSIRKSFNVSSITDNATGRYTINFTTAFSDANYAIVVTSDRANAPSNIGIINTYSENAPTASSYSFRFSDVLAFNTVQDQNYFYAVVFGD